MIKNAPVLEIQDFGSCGYEYRVDVKGGETFGYLSRDSQDNNQDMWMFRYGITTEEADASDPVWYEDYTLSDLKDELEFELTNFYIRFGLHDCKYEL